MTNSFNINEYTKLSRDLKKYHNIFSKIWSLGTPIFTDSVPTAQVSFDRESTKPLKFYFNETLWHTLSDNDRKFLIVHECSHILLNHPSRIKNIKNVDFSIINIALDLALNQFIDGMGFNKNTEFIQSMQWPEYYNLPKNLTFEEYYSLLKQKEQNEQKNQEEQELDSKSKELDQSDQKLDQSDQKLDQSGDSDDLEQPDEYSESYNGFGAEGNSKGLRVQDHKYLADEYLINYINDHFSQDLNDFFEKNKYNKELNNTEDSFSVSITKRREKKSWSSLVRQWTRVAQNMKQDAYNWTKKNRRSADTGTLIMPSYQNDDNYHSKIKLWLFLDVSISCDMLIPFFVDASQTFPKNHFEVKYFVFANNVSEATIEKNKVKYSNLSKSGTSFYKISDYINQSTENPDMIMVFTDGESWHVDYKNPEKWFWMIKGASAQSHYDKIPERCHKYFLDDFVA